MRHNLPSATHFDFNDAINVLDVLEEIHLSDADFLQEKYHASRENFDNEVATRVVASFGRELPQIFGKV